MKITNRSWIFRLLNFSALVLAFGLMLAGCDASTITIGSGLVLGGIIGSSVGHVFIGIIVGGIIGFIVFMIIAPSSSSSSYSNYSSGPSMRDWAESRKNDPHTCNNCGKYSNGREECRLDGSSRAPEDRCNNWQ